MGDPGADPGCLGIRRRRSAALLRRRHVGSAGGRRAPRARRSGLATAMSDRTAAATEASGAGGPSRASCASARRESRVAPRLVDAATPACRRRRPPRQALDHRPATTGSAVTEKGLPHARASVLNLDRDRARRAAAERVVGRMIGLGFRHPSRAIVLVASPAGQARPSTRRSARTATLPHRGGGAGLLRGGRAHRPRRGGRHLAGIVAPLLIHDLPTLRLVARRPAVRRPGLRPAGRDGRPAHLRQHRLRRPAARATAGWPTCAAAAESATWPGSAWPGGRS